MPVFTADQLVPLSVEINAALSRQEIRAAHRKGLDLKVVNPLLTFVQLVPLSVERKTPLSLVPAKRFVPLTASDQTFDAFVKPLLTALQLAPLLVSEKRRRG